MAYYTGTDVKVWILTETPDRGIGVVDVSNSTDESNLVVVNNGEDTSYNVLEIYPRNSMAGVSGFNLPDITGVDLSISAQDEDISYFGTKTVGKFEIKSDITVTITKKKSSKLFSMLAQGNATSTYSSGTGGHAARHGLIDDPGSAGTYVISNGTTDPKSSIGSGSKGVSYGYRVYVQLKAAGGTDGDDKDGAVVALRNCTLSEYTSTVSNDAANEETISFVSAVSPLYGNGLLIAGGGSEEGIAANKHFKTINLKTPATEM
ncbi:hypothetical protein CL634_03500 [bacterium]|nr:hypothetical protein [bacterium]